MPVSVELCPAQSLDHCQPPPVPALEGDSTGDRDPIANLEILSARRQRLSVVALYKHRVVSGHPDGPAVSG